jgi:hypothetical protein
MIPMNKERAVFAVVLVIAIYGFATAFQSQVVSQELPDELPPPADGPAPPMKLVKAGFLENSFDYYWGGDTERDYRDPWTIRRETRQLTTDMVPLEMPPLAEIGKVVPIPPKSPRQGSWPVIRQYEPPASLEDTEPEPGSEPEPDTEEDEG